MTHKFSKLSENVINWKVLIQFVFYNHSTSLKRGFPIFGHFAKKKKDTFDFFIGINFNKRPVPFPPKDDSISYVPI